MGPSAAYLRRAEATGARGGIGRRARFRSVFRKEWWFDSTRAHHSLLCQIEDHPQLSGYWLPVSGRISQSGRQKRPRSMSAHGGETMDWTSLRLTWEPRMLSILRIIVGLLFLKHGTQKIFDFPPRPQARPFELFTLNPGL